MGKYKVKMKITGFEMEIEGSRDDVPMISQNLARQLGGFLQPASAIVEGEIIEQQEIANSQLPLPGVEQLPAKKQRKRRSNSSKSENSEKTVALDWRHDASKYGMPKQEWTTATKALWLLYVVQEVMQVNEATSALIAESFNKHFRQSGEIKTFNVTRDLGKLKAKGGAVAEDTTKNPSAWYLTIEGIKQVQSMIAEVSQNH